MKYLQGHLKNAVNLPAFRALDTEAKLLPGDKLKQWVGAAGLDTQTTPVIYDSYDGRNGAMLAWILEYLGCTDIHVLDVFFERWVAEKREVLRSLQKVCKSHQAAAFDFITTLMPSANC